MEFIVLIIIIDIILIGCKYKRGQAVSDITMCFEKCDRKSCGACIDNGQCNFRRDVR